MDDRDPGIASRSLGYLCVQGRGGITAREMGELLAAVDDAYAAVVRAEYIVLERTVALSSFARWSRRWGPPEMFGWAGLALSQSSEASFEPDVPLVVSRVVLRSPGFWEFMGSLNPLEVLRKYLIDRHERRKDDDFRSAAEAERLALENAVLSLEVLKRYRELERESDAGPGADMLRQRIVGTVRPALERLGEFDDRGLIDGGTASTDREPPDERELPEGVS